MIGVVSVALSLGLSAAQGADAHTPARLKVLVLDVATTDLTESEKMTLTNLEAAHLAEDARLEVLSGQDLKQLMALQAQAQELGAVDGNCTDACMAELAGALGAGLVIATQCGRLGETLAVTLVVFDAARAKSVSRTAVQVSSIGELPAQLPAALDALLQPLLPATLPSRERQPPPPATPKALSGRAQDVYQADAINVCVSPDDPGRWWFCTQRAGMSDRTFAIRYRELTDSHALSAVEGNPLLPGEILLPIGVVGTAAFFASVAATGGLFGADAKGLGVDGPYGWAGIGAGVVGFGGLIIGSGLLLGEIARDGDRDSAEALAGQSHVLSEGEARAAAAKYDDALKAKVARDFGVL